MTSYSDSNESLAWKRTPWVTRTYGTGAVVNDIGRLTSVENGDNYRYYFYDELGRVKAIVLCGFLYGGRSLAFAVRKGDANAGPGRRGRSAFVNQP